MHHSTRSRRTGIALTAMGGALAVLAACSGHSTATAGASHPASSAPVPTPSASAAPATATVSAAPSVSPSPSTTQLKPAAIPVVNGTPLPLVAPSAIHTVHVTLPAPSCSAPAGSSWISVDSAPVQDGEGVYVVSHRTTMSCQPGFGPIVTASSTRNPTYFLSPTARVTLLSTGFIQTSATVADFQQLVAAHSAGKSSAGGFAWAPTSIFTIRLDAGGTIVSIADSALTTDN
ncbi:hypothetical protein [Streptacidiphilus sp. EB129]|uniref:hypothetical protein n=1 Tax=Streptacidiphilus sp. EB129 TaxID=3156262 RepID=UPI0035178E9A